MISRSLEQYRQVIGSFNVFVPHGKAKHQTLRAVHKSIFPTTINHNAFMIYQCNNVMIPDFTTVLRIRAIIF